MCDFENEELMETEHDEVGSRAHCMVCDMVKLARYKELISNMEKSLKSMKSNIGIDLSGDGIDFWWYAFKFDEANGLLEQEFRRKGR